MVHYTTPSLLQDTMAAVRRKNYVVKRDGRTEPIHFDKITTRIESLCFGLNLDHVDPTAIAQKVIQGIYPGVTTKELDELAAREAAAMVVSHPDYGKLAARIAISNLHKQTKKSFSSVMQSLHEFVHPRTNKRAPLISDEIMGVINEHKATIDSALVYNRDYQLTYFSYQTLMRAYLLRMQDGPDSPLRVVECPQHMYMRIALGIHGDNIDAAIETYHLLSKHYFTHASPTMFHAGTPHPQMASCFLLDMVDDSIEGIYDTLKACAIVSKSAGGVGLSVHKIRAKGSYIAGTNGESNGLVPMLRVFNNCFPEDHEILTAHGYMDYRAVLAHFAENETLRVACSVDGALEYHPITADKVTVDRGVHRHILMATADNGVSVFPTDNHRMWARVGATSTLDGQWTNDKPDYQNISASDVFVAAEVQFTARFPKGIAAALPLSELPFVGALDLTTDDQRLAFVELYGYWLGAGWLDEQVGVVFDTAYDVFDTYLESLFARIQLPSMPTLTKGALGYCKVDIPLSKDIIYVTAPSWWAFFASVYNETAPKPTLFKVVCDAMVAMVYRQPAVKPTKGDRWMMDWVWSLGRDHARALLRGLHVSDQHVSDVGLPTVGMIRTSSTRFRDEVDRLATHAGYTAIVSVVTDKKGGDSPAAWAIEYSDETCFAEPTLRAQGLEEHFVNSRVWCVTVPTEEHLIMVRRPLFADNCEWANDTKDMTIACGDTVRLTAVSSRPIIVGNTARYVDQGGNKRPGAFAIYLEPWHADIFDFISMKRKVEGAKGSGVDENKGLDLFYALWVPDLFWKRAEADADWTLMCPHECPGLDTCWGDAFEALYERYEREGKGRRTIKTRELVGHIVETAMNEGVPYILNKDACNCFGRDTLVMMATGETAPVQSLVVGDKVMGPDGSARTIQDGTVVTGTAFMYEIVPARKGWSSWTCTSNHILVLVIDHASYVEPVADRWLVKAWYIRPGNHPGSSVPHDRVVASFVTKREAMAYNETYMTSPIVFECVAADYFGLDADVQQRCKLMRPSQLSYPPRADNLHTIMHELHQSDISVTDVAWLIGLWFIDGDTNEPVIFQETNGTCINLGPNMWRLIKRLGVDNKKKVPNSLLMDTVAVRRKLLAGFVGGLESTRDGHRGVFKDMHHLMEAVGNDVLARCDVTISHENRHLVDSIVHLARGLGYVVDCVRPLTPAVDGTPCDAYATTIYKQRSGVAGRCSKFKVTSVGDAPYHGFGVDGDERFLLGDFTVVHNSKSNQQNLGTIKSSNLCVHGDTLILTEHGHLRIGDFVPEETAPTMTTTDKVGETVPVTATLVDEDDAEKRDPTETTVWNGHGWSKVNVRKTGLDEEIMTVTTSFGTRLKCTPGHKFILENGDRVDASALTLGAALAPERWAPEPADKGRVTSCVVYGGVPEATMGNPFLTGYVYGYITRTQGTKSAFLGPTVPNVRVPWLIVDKTNKTVLKKIGYDASLPVPPNASNTEELAYFPVPEQHQIKRTAMANSAADRTEWVAGFLSALGQLDAGAGSYDLLYRPWLMLRGTGRDCKLVQMHGDPLRPMWKLKWADPDERPVVIGLERSGERADTYCFTEPEHHAGVFGGQLTGQCSEIIEYTDKDNVAVCNLASIGLAKFVVQPGNTYDFASLHRVTKVITQNLNNTIDRNMYRLPQMAHSNLQHRPIGIGVQALADTFCMMGLPFDSPEARLLNKQIFETIYHGFLEKSCELAAKHGPYASYEGSPMSQGKLQFDLWSAPKDPAIAERLLSTAPTDLWDWDTLRANIAKHGVRNSQGIALPPTASTSQIMNNNECFEPFTSNLFTRKVLSGVFQVVNPHLMNDLIKLNLWDESMRDMLIAARGSVQHIESIPDRIKEVYRTAWEIPQKHILEMAADRGAYVDQSQSMNVRLESPEARQVASMYLYGWKLGLKTGQYYLRVRTAVAPIQFTVSAESKAKAKAQAQAVTQEALACSIKNKEACVSCSS